MYIITIRLVLLETFEVPFLKELALINKFIGFRVHFIPASPAPQAAEGRLRRAASKASWGAALCFKFMSISGAAVYRGCATVFGARGEVLMPQWGYFDTSVFVNIVNI